MRLLPLLLLAPCLLLRAENVDSITVKHYSAMLGELRQYIASTPEAADVNEAYDAAMQAAFFSKQFDQLLEILNGRFDSLLKQNPVPAHPLLQSGMLLTQFSLEHGKPELAEKVLKEFTALAESGADPTIFPEAARAVKQMLAKPAVGSPMNFTATTVDGKEFELASLKGKVVLVDFWATWCGPCIAEMPNVKRVYEQYHGKGFEIVAVSLDRNKADLQKFLEKEKITWTNIFDQDQKDSLAERFSIESIPSLFLLDREGRIVAVNPRGPALEKAVADLLKTE